MKNKKLTRQFLDKWIGFDEIKDEDMDMEEDFGLFKFETLENDEGLDRRMENQVNDIFF